MIDLFLLGAVAVIVSRDFYELFIETSCKRRPGSWLANLSDLKSHTHWSVVVLLAVTSSFL